MRYHSLMQWISGVVVLFVGVLPGCSVFQGSRAMDMNPFAENTSVMFAEASKIARPPTWNYLKPYFNLPEVALYRERGRPVIQGMRAIVLYSNQLVALNMSTKPDKEKNKLLVAYFREGMAKVADRRKYESVGINPASLDTVLLTIEGAPTFMEGIQGASPLVNAVVLAMLNRLEELNDGVPVIIGSIEQEIEKEYQAQRQNYENLVRLQTQAHCAVTLLYDGRAGNLDAVDSALRVDPSLREFISSPGKATTKEFRAAEQSLTDRLEKLSTFLRQLDAEKAVYTAKQRELEELRVSVDNRVKMARDAIIFWAQSHRNLGAGVPVPPLFDVGAISAGLAKKVVPLP